jgi:uncharacterized protein (UPF0335 family)
MQEKEAIAKFVKLFMEEESLKEEIKGVADDAKESGLDVAPLKAIAKAVVANKVDELKEKSEALIRLVDIARS